MHDLKSEIFGYQTKHSQVTGAVILVGKSVLHLNVIKYLILIGSSHN